MLSLHSPTACGGIGAITLMVGAVILTMAGDGTAGTVLLMPETEYRPLLPAVLLL